MHSDETLQCAPCDSCAFDGQIVLITGAASGIGRAIALDTVRLGADVACCDIDESGLEALRKEISAAGTQARSFVDAADIAVADSIRQFVENAVRVLGVPTVLFANAAVTDKKHHRVVDMPIDTWDRVMQVNLSGTFYTVRAVLPYMLKAGHGNIVAITSILGQKGNGRAQDAPYCASKFGIEGLVEVVADECMPYGINVNTLYPSTRVNTGFFDYLSADERQLLSPPEIVLDAARFLAGLRPGSLTRRSVDAERWSSDPDYRCAVANWSC